MVARRVHRGMSKAQKEQIRRIMVDLHDHGTILRCVEMMIEFVNKLVADKYERGYHSGYTRGQRNPEKDLAGDL